MSSVRESTTSVPTNIQVGLLTGGFDRPYAFGLAMALISEGIFLDVVGGDEVDGPEMRSTPNLNFLNLRGDLRADATLLRKMSRVLVYYARLIYYARVCRPRILHILWNNRFQLFDRTLLMLYYKVQGKKIALTAHNVNAARRDSNDSLLNRLTLRIQYRLADHVFVHTEKMKAELSEKFGVPEQAITSIPFGINNAVPNTALTSDEAKQRLGIANNQRTLLFFGRIRAYKGVEYLIEAFQKLVAQGGNYRLIIAGEPKKDAQKYVENIKQTIGGCLHRERIIQEIRYITDEETEVYFKAADVLVLPYTEIFQSGVLLLGYSFGLPVVASDVGSLGQDIIEGRTGFLCKPCDSVDLARTIDKYFQSDLFATLPNCRAEIKEFATQRHSWSVIGQTTRKVYARLLNGSHQ